MKERLESKTVLGMLRQSTSPNDSKSVTVVNSPKEEVEAFPVPVESPKPTVPRFTSAKKIHKGFVYSRYHILTLVVTLTWNMSLPHLYRMKVLSKK
jgi:hypothetical protein